MAGPTLQKLKDDRVKAIEETLRKAIKARDTYEKRARKALERRGIDTRTAEKARLKWWNENKDILGAIHPDERE